MGGLNERSHTSKNSPGAGRRAPGCHIGFVTKVDDDREIARVKVRIPDLAGQKETDWARVLAPVGGIKSGGVLVPEEGTAVLVMFEQDDTNKPVVLGGIWFQEAEESQVPEAARGINDAVRDARGTDAASGAFGASLQEPPDPFGAKYPTNIIFKAPGAGHLIELDTTPGAERISITHGTTKTWIEMHPDGALVVGVKGKRYAVIDTDDQTHIKGNQDVAVDGKATHRATGEFASTAAGYRILSLGTWILEAAGLAQVKALSLAHQITTTYLITCVSYNLQASASILLQTAVLNMLVSGAVNMTAAAFTALISGTTTIGPGSSPGPVVTTLTHPFDFITGIPIVGVPSVLVG